MPISQDPVAGNEETGAARPSGRAPGDKSAEQAMQDAEFSEWETQRGFDRNPPQKLSQTGTEKIKELPAKVRQKVSDAKQTVEQSIEYAKSNPSEANRQAVSRVGSVLDQIASGNFGTTFATFQRGSAAVKGQMRQERKQPAPLSGWGYPGGLLGTGVARPSARRSPGRQPARVQPPQYRYSKWDTGLFIGGQRAVIHFTPEHSASFDLFNRHPVNALSQYPLFNLGFSRPESKKGKENTHPFDAGFRLHFSGALDLNRRK